MCYSRRLRPGCVLSEFTVMDGEIWTKVTAELQRTDGAERGHSVTTATTQHWYDKHSSQWMRWFCGLGVNMKITLRVEESSDWRFRYLTRASTVSEETVGDGAMMTSGSPSNMSSHRMCRWMRTDWKHLHRSKVTGKCNNNNNT